VRVLLRSELKTVDEVIVRKDTEFTGRHAARGFARRGAANRIEQMHERCRIPYREMEFVVESRHDGTFCTFDRRDRLSHVTMIMTAEIPTIFSAHRKDR
jgi:hypothetical protein